MDASLLTGSDFDEQEFAVDEWRRSLFKPVTNDYGFLMASYPCFAGQRWHHFYAYKSAGCLWAVLKFLEWTISVDEWYFAAD